MADKLLEIKNLHVNYGAIKAIKGIDLYVDKIFKFIFTEEENL